MAAARPEIHCSPTHVIVDVGGNIGTFGVLVASMVDRGRVVIAEPSADNLRLLQLNLALNHVKNASVCPVAAARTAQCWLSEQAA